MRERMATMKICQKKVWFTLLVVGLLSVGIVGCENPQAPDATPGTSAPATESPDDMMGEETDADAAEGEANDSEESAAEKPPMESTEAPAEKPAPPEEPA